MKHKHHIIPKHMGGSDNADNIVELTVEEHAEAHKKLYEQHGHWQDYCAWQALSGRIGQEEILRMKQGANKGKALPQEWKDRIAEAKKGTKMSEETKRKISKAHKGKKKSAEHMKNWSASRKGHIVSEETKAKIRKARAKQKNVRGVIQDV